MSDCSWPGQWNDICLTCNDAKCPSYNEPLLLPTPVSPTLCCTVYAEDLEMHPFLPRRIASSEVSSIYREPSANCVSAGHKMPHQEAGPDESHLQVDMRTKCHHVLPKTRPSH